MMLEDRTGVRISVGVRSDLEVCEGCEDMPVCVRESIRVDGRLHQLCLRHTKSCI